MRNEKPNWERGDTIKSLYGVYGLAKVALANIITNVKEFPSKLDTWACNQINGDDDE